MLIPVPSKNFVRDFKRIIQNPKFSHVEYLTVLSLLINEQSLPQKYCNHPLAGDYKGFLDCHITNDCVLIYKILDTELLLARIGTHSELFR
jgi:mRNA interferase YafQ